MRYWISLILILLSACSSVPPPKEEVFDKRNLATQYMEFGNRYYQDADYQQALQLYLLAKNYFASVDDTEGIIGAYNALGKTYLQLGMPSEAEAHISFALDIAKSSRKDRFILQTVNHLTGVLLQRGAFSQAQSLLEEYRSLIPQTPPWAVEYSVYYHNLGAALQALKRSQEAEQAISRAVAMNLELKNFGELASNYYLLALIHQTQGNLSQAMSDAETALKYDKQMENSMGIAQDLLLLGFLKERSGNPLEAFDLYSRSYLVYRALNHRSGMERSLKRLEEAAEKSGKSIDAKLYREAREALETTKKTP
ncbi:MAG: hypothetical protein N2442_04520 [Spirochaetes bacterium]|nr:hypothetical protein [Spirochaetota bacterium]